MKQKVQLVVTIFFFVYLAIVLLTDISLTGYWTDIIASILLSMLTLFIDLKNKINESLSSRIVRAINILCWTVVIGMLGVGLVNPITWDTLKIRSFYYESVDGRLFNAYFKPVGAYSGGEGNFWITESPKYFPLIEREAYYEHAIMWDFNAIEWEGEVIDQNKIVRDYIMTEVIKKQQTECDE